MVSWLKGEGREKKKDEMEGRRAALDPSRTWSAERRGVLSLPKWLADECMRCASDEIQNADGCCTPYIPWPFIPSLATCAEPSARTAPPRTPTRRAPYVSYPSVLETSPASLHRAHPASSPKPPLTISSAPRRNLAQHHSTAADAAVAGECSGGTRSSAAPTGREQATSARKRAGGEQYVVRARVQA